MSTLRDKAIRITSETGGEKDQKLAQIGALDPVALLEVGRVAGFGATKYARHNFLKGYDWSLSLDAMLRHVMAYNAGENVDPESGLLHMAHAAWHALAMAGFQLRGIGTDDRPPAVHEDQPEEDDPVLTPEQYAAWRSAYLKEN